MRTTFNVQTATNVIIEIHPGQTFTYQYDLPANHPVGSFWYHPHKHGSVAMQLFSGMLGAIIIERGADRDSAKRSTAPPLLLVML